MSLKEALFSLSRKRGLEFAGIAAYSLCARIVSSYFRTKPEIRSAYLAGSMSGGDIVPGLSDIDFVVVVKDMLPREEFDFYSGLEGTLRYILPPPGEDKIGSHVTCYSMSEWELLGDIFINKGSGAPLAVFEKDHIEFKYSFGGPIKSLHHFYKAHWRLEMIEQDIINPPENDYQFRLKERLLERCFRSIRNGIEEAGLMTDGVSRVTDLENEIKDMISESAIAGKDNLHPAILTRLLHFYDLASGGLDSKSGHSLESIGNVHGEYRRSDTVREVSMLLKDEAANAPIFYCPAEKIDYFIYDLSRYSVTEKIIGRYRSKNRRFSILSESRIRNNYYVFRENEPPFICLGDDKQYVLNPEPDRERIILEAYTIFPQLRTRANVKNPAKYNAFREKAGRLIEVIESATPSGYLRTDINKENVRDRESPHRVGNEYERFEILNEASSIMRDTLTAFLKSNNKTRYDAGHEPDYSALSE